MTTPHPSAPQDDHLGPETVGETPFVRPVRHLHHAPRSPAEGPPPLLTALHGQGMGAKSFRRVLRHLKAPRHAHLYPEGPHVFEQRRPDGIRAGHAWYIYLGDSPSFRRELEATEAHLLSVIDRCEEEHGCVDRARSVLLGFSQGGYLAGFVALRHPHRFGGLVISAARLKHEFLTDELAGGRLPAVLLLHSPDDPATAFERAEESRAVLAQAGADVELHSHAGGHRLTPDALARGAGGMEERGLVP
ncbi:MAG: alpha/beta hydrolase [Planctomycetota bacterium]